MDLKEGDRVEVLFLKDYPFGFEALLPNGQKQILPIKTLGYPLLRRPEPGDVVLMLFLFWTEREQLALSAWDVHWKKYPEGRLHNLPAELKARERKSFQDRSSACKWPLGTVLQATFEGGSGFVSLLRMPDGSRNWIHPRLIDPPVHTVGDSLPVLVLEHRRDGRCRLSGLKEDIDNWGQK